MTDLQDRTTEFLEQFAVGLRKTTLPPDLAQAVDRLIGQVEEPCVVAVVGRVNAGKSTFVNALLGQDLAVTGTTETTATVNYFRYGTPDPARAVRCHWRSGQITDADASLLASLQGHDIETLERADGIDFLEYFLPNPVLKHVTLVDTPGTGAAVQAHQERTERFLGLEGQLRQRHDHETERVRSKADAVIYLIGAVARTDDRALLEQFGEVTGQRSRATQALGVIAKVDLSSELLARRHDLAAKVARQLDGSLNTVVPVSAALQRALSRLQESDGAGLDRLVGVLRQIPPDRLEMLLDSDEFFCNLDFDDCPVSATERRAILGDLPWGVFTTAARILADFSTGIDTAVAQLAGIAGFEDLRRTLQHQLFIRGQTLRCYRILQDVAELLSTIKYVRFPELRRNALESEARLERFLSLVNQTSGNEEVAKELSAYLTQQLDTTARAGEIEWFIHEKEVELAALTIEVSEYSADFEALGLVEEHRDLLPTAEFDELRALLGLYGLALDKRVGPARARDAAHARQRQITWGQRVQSARPGSIIRKVAERAYVRYGLIYAQLVP